MFCTKCGMENADGSSFCVYCSANLNEGESYSADGTPVVTPPQKKGIKPLYLIIGAAAVVLVVVLLIVLLSGGSSPEGVVEDYIEAEFTADYELLGKCSGFDYKQTGIESIDDLDDRIESFESYQLNWLADDYEDVGMDLLEWEDRLYEIDSEEEFVEFMMEFNIEYRELYIEEYECSYEITRIEATELTSRSDIKDAEEAFEDWYDDLYEEGCVLLFEEDDVETFYTVDVKVRFEEDGERDSEKATVLVVETSEGCFIVDFDY